MKRRLSKKVGIDIKLYRKLKWLTMECVREYVFDRWGDHELNDENVIRIRKDIRNNVEGFLYWWSNEIASHSTDLK
jgi:hypothetical protein